MRNAMWQITAAFFGMTVALSSLPLSAQDIVIDSGTDETVISRLPAAPAQEDAVCSDSADGTLGPCASIGAGLAFYETESVDVRVPQDEDSGAGIVSCEAGDIMMGPARMNISNHASSTFELSSWTFTRPDSGTLIFGASLFAPCPALNGCLVMNLVRGLCLDATP